MANQSEWNFIFLIYADLRTDAKDPNSDTAKFAKLKDVLLRIPVAKECNLFVIKNLVTIDNIINKNKITDKFICGRYIRGREIKFDIDAVVKVMNDKPKIIGRYLKKISEKIPAKKTILFTWDHGNVFGINKVAFSANMARDERREGEVDVFPEYDFYINPLLYQQTNSIDKDKAIENVLNDVTKPNTILSRFIGAVMPNKFDKNVEPVIDMLTNEMLANSLEFGKFNKRNKIDVVCMMNCCMQNLHTQFALHEYVENLVAPQTWIYFPGYDYPSIFNELFIKPQMDGDELASLIVKTCKDDALKPSPLVKEIQYEGIFAINLGGINEVAELIKEIIVYESSEIISNSKHEAYLYSLCHNPFIEFEQQEIVNYRLIDMYQLYGYRTGRSSPKYPSQQLRYCQLIHNRFQRSILNSFVGNLIRKINGKDISGMTLSLPDFPTYTNPNQIFIKLFYKKGSRYQSRLIRYLDLDTLIETIY